ncbi:MAG TPA: twin-arginine translocase TatA/TatE family subunit [Dehalococcoidia bacterium]|nr:twin-arginine translocase TatA/TatE family subunit [Dehalococcoidia bacterium]
MNFLGVGPAELIVILVVALVFVGPERLPRLAADIARTIREVRKYTGSLAAEFNEVIAEFDKETETDRGQWKEIGEGLNSATKSLTDAIRGARADAEAAGTKPASNGATNGAVPATNGAVPVTNGATAASAETMQVIPEPEPEPPVQASGAVTAPEPAGEAG